MSHPRVDTTLLPHQHLYLMAGMVLRVIPTVETTTKMNEMKETVWGEGTDREG